MVFSYLLVQNLSQHTCSYFSSISYSFFVFCCPRRGVSRCKHCSPAAKGSRSQPLSRAKFSLFQYSNPLLSTYEVPGGCQTPHINKTGFFQDRILTGEARTCLCYLHSSQTLIRFRMMCKRRCKGKMSRPEMGSLFPGGG